MVVEVTPIDVNKICNREDHIIEDSSRNSISNQFNNKGAYQTNPNNLPCNNTANIIYYGNYVHGNMPRGRVLIINSNTVGERDDYPQSVYAIVTCGHDNIPCINNNGENMITYPNPVVPSEIYTQMDYILDNHNISSLTQGDYVNDRGRHNMMSYTNNMDTNIVLDFKMIDNSEAVIHNETCTKVDHKTNICSHNATSRHSNNEDNNKIYAISSGRAVDNYTQLVSLTDMDRTSNNYRNPLKRAIIG